MTGTVDLLAVVYAYLLAFITLSVIVALLRVSTWLLSRRAAGPPATPAAGGAPKPEVVEEAARPPVASKVAAAVVAVATHLSLQRAGPPASAVTPLGMAPQPWVHQWRVQASASPNELWRLRQFRNRKV